MLLCCVDCVDIVVATIYCNKHDNKINNMSTSMINDIYKTSYLIRLYKTLSTSIQGLSNLAKPSPCVMIS